MQEIPKHLNKIIYRQNLRIIFFSPEAKSAVIALVTTSIFNERRGEKKLKFLMDNLVQVLLSLLSQ